MKYLISFIIVLYSFPCMAQEILKDSTDLMGISVLDSIQQLEEIVVKGYRPISKVTREGVSYSVKDTPLAQSGAVTEVLELIPMIKKTTAGFEVVGKGTAVFYVNDRRIYDLSDLDDIAAKEIKNVEVITSPGAQYDSSISSIIKITTASNALEGLTFNARSMWYQNRHGNWSEQLNFRYNTKRLTIYDNIKYQADNDLTWKDINQTAYADTLWRLSGAEQEYRKKRTLSNIFGVDYKISEDNYIGGRYSLTYSLRNAMNLDASSEMTANAEHYDFLKTKGDERAYKCPQNLFNVYYSGLIGGYKMNADVDYITSTTKTENNYYENSDSKENRNIDALSDIKNRLFSLRASIGHKLYGGNITVGMEFRHTNRKDDYINSGEYIPMSISLLKETQYAPFVDYSLLTKVGLFGFGVRMENTRFKYYSDGKYIPEQSQSTNKFFPKFSWGIRLGALQAQLGYSTGINRPTYRQLSNNTLYASRYTWQTGNPLLRPEYIHELSLQGLWRFIQFQASYSDVRNAIVNWGHQLTSQQAVSIMSYKNLASVKQMRLAVVFQRTLDFWSPQLTLAMNKQFLHLDTRMQTFNLNAPIGIVKLSNSFKISPTFTVFLTANYQSPGDYRNVHLSRHVWSVNFNATKSFFHERFSLQLKVNDLFHTNKDGNEVYSDCMTMNILNTYDSRAVSLTLRYQFNPKAYKRHSHSSVDRELNRLN